MELVEGHGNFHQPRIEAATAWDPLAVGCPAGHEHLGGPHMTESGSWS
jgi:hypothetical protein